MELKQQIRVSQRCAAKSATARHQHRTDRHAGARWSNDGSAPRYVLAKSRSSTVGAVGTPVQSVDVLGSYVFAGDDGAQLVQGAEMRAIASDDWSSGSGRSARLEIRTRHQDSIGVRFPLKSDGSLELLDLATTASGANAYLDAGNSNNLLRSTSSLRYKRDVEDLAETTADGVLSLRPVRYRSTASADRPDWTHYGLIAEEPAAVDPRRCTGPIRTTHTMSSSNPIPIRALKTASIQGVMISSSRSGRRNHTTIRKARSLAAARRKPWSVCPSARQQIHRRCDASCDRRATGRRRP